MTGQALCNTNRGVTGLVWIGGGCKTGGQVSMRSLPCKRQLWLQKQVRIQRDKEGIRQLLFPMALQHWCGLYKHLFSSGCPLRQWSSNPQGRGPQLAAGGKLLF